MAARCLRTSGGREALAAHLTGQAAQVSMTHVAWASLLFQGIVVSFASSLVHDAPVRRHPGVLVLREQADFSFVVGAVLVLTGILIVSAPGLLRPRPRLKTAT